MTYLVGEVSGPRSRHLADSMSVSPEVVLADHPSRDNNPFDITRSSVESRLIHPRRDVNCSVNFFKFGALAVNWSNRSRINRPLVSVAHDAFPLFVVYAHGLSLIALARKATASTTFIFLYCLYANMSAAITIFVRLLLACREVLTMRLAGTHERKLA